MYREGRRHPCAVAGGHWVDPRPNVRAHSTDHRGRRGKTAERDQRDRDA
jgi:hypothetical protein